MYADMNSTSGERLVSNEAVAQNEMAKRMFCLEKALQTHGPVATPESVVKTAGEYLMFISPPASRIVTPR